jgi:hypothetical protein
VIPARSAGVVARAVDFGLAASAFVIAVFHAGLFWTQLTTGRILDPETAVRWAVAGALVIALVALRRVGVSLLWSRHAAVLWVLVALLHCGISAPVSDASASYAVDPALIFVLPSATAVILTGTAGLWLLGRGSRVRLADVAQRQMLWLVREPATAALSAGFSDYRAPRPPPAI